jgi:hypothetical protein
MRLKWGLFLPSSHKSVIVKGVPLKPVVAHFDTLAYVSSKKIIDINIYC